ncbi:unnamed protein product [Calicophoron daubneyi]|uniref:Uncharacterized protein n=1 Tax=Calicophoron daubneyi TaxID=300641 RepID=A0AAV2TW51_CALDB
MTPSVDPLTLVSISARTTAEAWRIQGAQVANESPPRRSGNGNPICQNLRVSADIYTVDDFPNLNKKVYHTKPVSGDGEAYITVLHYNPNVATCVVYSKERPLDGSLRIEMETNDAGLCKMISNVKETSGTGFLSEYQLVPNYDGNLVGSYILECRARFRRVGKINAMFFVTFPLEKSSTIGRSILLEHYKSTDLLELHINRSRGWFRVGHALILFIRLGSHNVVGEKSFGGLLPILSVDLTIAPNENCINTHGVWKSREVEVEELEDGQLRISLNCTDLVN